MIEPRGVIYRLLPGVPPSKEWLTRCEALFADDEWQWIPTSTDAYVFPSYQAAEDKAAELQARMTTPVIPMVFREPYHDREVVGA